MEACSPVILIAEDDAGHFALVKKNLWRTYADAEIIHFQNGRQLLDFLFKASGSSLQPHRPYLLLLDIKMPLVDGLSALERIKAHPELKKMPVFMLTTTDSPVEVNHCYDSGCNFYIVKPSDYIQFMQVIESLGAVLTAPGLAIPDINPENIATMN